MGRITHARHKHAFAICKKMADKNPNPRSLKFYELMIKLPRQTPGNITNLFMNIIQNHEFDEHSDEVVKGMNHCMKKIGVMLTQYNTTAAVTSLEAISPTNAGKTTAELKVQYLRRKLTEIEKELVPYRKTKDDYDLERRDSRASFSDEHVGREILKNFERAILGGNAARLFGLA